MIKEKRYDASSVLTSYHHWLESDPFDCGSTIHRALQGYHNQESQANGALMRISPLAIFGVHTSLVEVATWAKMDACLTHPHKICQEINMLYVMALSTAIKRSIAPDQLYQQIRFWAEQLSVDPIIIETIYLAKTENQENFIHQQGWVIIAFHNALYQLLHAPNLEEGVVDTVMRGGDTNTNAAIVGALLGAVYGIEVIPAQWQESVLNCRPQAGKAGVYQPRPEEYWPVDILMLAEQLL